MGRRTLLTLVALSLGYAMPPDVSHSQLLESALSTTARPFQGELDCASAPHFCEGSTDFLELGTYEFDVQLGDMSIQEARFSLNWPGDWRLVEWSNCSSARVDGD